MSVCVFGKRRGEAANEVIGAKGAGFITARRKVREGKGWCWEGGGGWAKERRRK